MPRRLDRLRASMADARIDGLLVCDRANTLYLTGFQCSNSLIVITAGRALFLTDFRYMEKASQAIKGFEVRQIVQRSLDEVAALVSSLKVRRLGFEGTMPYSTHSGLAAKLRGVKMVEAGGLPSGIRAVKEPGEIGLIAASQRLNERILSRALKNLDSRMTEADIAAAIHVDMIRCGAEPAFDTIIASGPNSSLPHAVPAARRARRGEFLLFDMGVRKNLYNSDMTRTVIVGTPSARHREVYKVVLEAQQCALDTIRAGVPARIVDAAARNTIAKHGYGAHFGHGLGHGVGLEIHEGPTLNPRSTDTLEAGMVVTVEPGIYIPGFGGVRIEDLVVVTRTGFTNLTQTGKRLRLISV